MTRWASLLRSYRSLRKLGWSVVRVWEHELKDPEKVAAKLKRALVEKSAG
jgi:G:T-mismatch repair DNA endonuclease (very short patch repair protein)